MPETIYSTLRDHIERVALRIVVGFGLCWWDVSDRSEKAPVVEPIDPFEGRPFDGLQVAPRPAATDDLVASAPPIGMVARILNSSPALHTKTVPFSFTM